MNNVYKQLILYSPLLILGLTLLSLVILVSYKRNHFSTLVLSIIGINFSLLSLNFLTERNSSFCSSIIYFDSFSIFYISLILIIGQITCILSYDWLSKYIGNKEEFYILLIIAIIGSIVLIYTNNLSGLFIGTELISVPLFGMIGFDTHQKQTLEASIKYMLLSMIASSFMLFGIAIFYLCNGYLHFSPISNLSNSPIMISGLIMIFFGIGFKLSLIPFHLWTPDVYQGSSIPASIFLATISKISIFATISRLFFCISIGSIEPMNIILNSISTISILFGNLLAVNQNDIKRMLGYSSITHFGYLLRGLTIKNNTSMLLETFGIYLFGYTLSILLIYSIIILVNKHELNSRNRNSNSLSFYEGFFWENPLIAFMLTVAMFSLSGVPITIGFLCKFYILMIGIKEKLYWFVGSVVISSIIGVYCYLHIVFKMFIPNKKHVYYKIFSDTSSIIYTSISVIITTLVVGFGLCPNIIISLIRKSIKFI